MTSGTSHLTPIDADTACRVLAAVERRTILDHLLSTETDTVQFEALARHVKAEQESDDPKADSDELGPIILELLHQHIPQLEAAGLIEVDSRSETIVATDEIEQLRPILDALEAV